MLTLAWRWLSFEQLTLHDLYALLASRQRVFVVEQECPYLDADGLDRDAWHLLGEQEGRLCAYLRVLPPGARFSEPSIGRVLTLPEVRGRGMGRLLMEEGIRRLGTLYPDTPIRISAQCYLEEFYASLGFLPVSDSYAEDGIPHREMLLPVGPAAPS